MSGCWRITRSDVRIWLVRRSSAEANTAVGPWTGGAAAPDPRIKARGHGHALAPLPGIGDATCSASLGHGADPACAGLEPRPLAGARPDLPMLYLAGAAARPRLARSGTGCRLGDGDPDRDALAARAADRAGRPHPRAVPRGGRLAVDRVGGDEGAGRVRAPERQGREAQRRADVASSRASIGSRTDIAVGAEHVVRVVPVLDLNERGRSWGRSWHGRAARPRRRSGS